MRRRILKTPSHFFILSSSLSFLNFPSFFYPIQNPFVQVVYLKSFLDKNFSCGAASFPASAINGYLFVLSQQFIDVAGKIFIFHIDIETTEDVPFRVFFRSTNIQNLYLGILDEFLKLS